MNVIMGKNLNKSRVLLFVNLTFILGVGFRSFFFVETQYVVIGVAGFLILVFLLRNVKLRFVSFLGIFFFLGIFRYHADVPRFDNDTFISRYANETVAFEGFVCGEPDERTNNRKYTVCASSITRRKKETRVFGKVLVTSRLYPRYEYGDRVDIFGKILAPEPFDGFSYDRYLARFDIYSVMYFPDITLRGSEGGLAWYGKILTFKSSLEKTIEKYVSEPEASILNALIFGTRGGMPKDIQEDLSSSGIMHLIAISGSHITLLMAMLMAAAPYVRLSRTRAFYLITLAIMFYIIIIGAPASAVRAAVMGWLVLYAMKHGRLSQIFPSLVLAAAVMVLITPRILRDDIGFQLSFLSVWGMATFLPLWEKKFERVPNVFEVKNIIFMTVASYIATLPLVVYYFGKISFISPLANIMTVPVFSVIFVSTLLALGLVLFVPIAGQFVFFIPYLFVSYMISAGKFFADIPFAYIDFKQPPMEILIGVYIVMIYFLYFRKLSHAA